MGGYEVSFQELKAHYDKVGAKCGRLGYIYQPQHIENRVIPQIKQTLKDPIYYEEWLPDRLLPIRCNNYGCKVCRPVLKNRLHQNIIREVSQNNLNYHFIVTFPGSWLRNKIPYNESFKVLNYEFNKLMHRIRYDLTKLKKGIKTRSKNSVLRQGFDVNNYEISMITMARAQTNPSDSNPIGYCHLHNITNLPLNIDYMQEKISKNDYKIGYQFIRENQSVAEYLCKDFFDDKEWIIPLGYSHYRSTQNIHINANQGTRLSNNEIMYKTNDIGFIENDLRNRGLNLPFNIYLNEFYDLTNINDNIDNIIRKNNVSVFEIIKGLNNGM